MQRSQIRTLKPLSLSPRPLTSHAIAWSCDAELAVATDDTVHIFFPEYNTPGDESEVVIQRQFTLSISAANCFMPLTGVNTQLCAQAGITLPPTNLTLKQEGITEGFAKSAVTGRGTVSQVIRVEWSPNGLGTNLRPILMVMTTSGELLALGEQDDSDSATSGIASFQTRSTKMWKILWGIGAGMPIPAEDHERAYRTMEERIVGFSWAKEVAPGQALFAYETDQDEIVVMSVQHVARAPDDYRWQVREVARFDGEGPHSRQDDMDPDFVPSETGFGLRWSPWVLSGGRRVAALAHITRNHVSFRKISISRKWDKDKEPQVAVAETDSLAICLPLRADAFVEWEDIVWSEASSRLARGVICTPFQVAPFQVDLLDDPKPPMPAHSCSDCLTTYTAETSTNPITGLVLYPTDPSQKTEVPLYMAVRLSVTAKNDDWFETNDINGQFTTPLWVRSLSRKPRRMGTRYEAPQALADSGSEDSSSDEEDAEVGNEEEKDMENGDMEGADESGAGQVPKKKIPLVRYRLRGLAMSPGGGCSAVVTEKQSTVYPGRKATCKVYFCHKLNKTDDDDRPPLDASSKTMTTEARTWEWMYGGGDHVPGVTVPIDYAMLEGNSPMRDFFKLLKAKQRCPFCQEKVRLEGLEARCSRNHTFASCSSSGLAILAPDVSRTCAVCRNRCLKYSELVRLAREEYGPMAPLPEPGESCGYCGGKYII